MNRVGVFVDCNNLYSTLGHTSKVDYSKYLLRAIGQGSLVRAFAYGSQVQTEAKAFRTYLKNLNYTVCYLPAVIIDGNPDIRRTYLNMKIAIDIITMITRLDTVVLGSNHTDFIPLYEYIKSQGVKVIILASRVKEDLRRSVDDVIEITGDILESKEAI